MVDGFRVKFKGSKWRTKK